MFWVREREAFVILGMDPSVRLCSRCLSSEPFTHGFSTLEPNYILLSLV